MVKITNHQSSHEEWLAEISFLSCRSSPTDSDEDDLFFSASESESNNPISMRDVLDSSNDDDDDEDIIIGNRRHYNLDKARSSTLNHIIDISSDEDEYELPQQQRKQNGITKIGRRASSTELPDNRKPALATSPQRTKLSVAEDGASQLEYIPIRFKRPPKIAERTSPSSIFDLSDSDSEIEYRKAPRSPTKKQAPLTPQMTGRSGKTLAPATIARLRRKDFEENREKFAKEYLELLDNTVNDGAVGRLTAQTGGMQLVWTNSKHSTAGECYTRVHSVQDKVYHFECIIKLEMKVCDDYDRVKRTLAHEYTHACVFILEIDRRRLNDKRAAGHGSIFKSWAKKVADTMNIPVPDTCHNYTINYKFEYQCPSCSQSYYAHTRRKEWTTTKGCEKCKLPLVQVKPVPRTAKKTTVGTVESTPTPYQCFQKEMFAKVKAELPPGSPHKFGDIQREVAKRWKEFKAREETSSSGSQSSSQFTLNDRLWAARDETSSNVHSRKDDGDTIFNTITDFNRLVITID